MNLNRLFTSRLWSFVALTGGNRKGAGKQIPETDRDPSDPLFSFCLLLVTALLFV